jgi:aminodeoxyfutalosine deaminase
MRRISADWVFPVSTKPLKRGIISVDEEGRILSVEDTGGNLPEIAGLEYYNGILIPGFVNAHCHLELSYLADSFPQHNGLPSFIKNIVIHKRPSGEEIQEAIRNADRSMWDAGIQAVGDISNNKDSFLQKTKSRIRYHNFIETFDLAGGTTAASLETATRLYRQAIEEYKLRASLVPHAVYTVSSGLFKEISHFAGAHPGPLSIHNQETGSEDEFIREGTGKLAELLLELGVRNDPGMHGESSSLRAILPLLPGNRNLLLVHNSFTNAEDLEYMRASGKAISLVLCPNANLYIENRLPAVPLMMESGLNICIGTDSLASNNGLSVLDELKSLSLFFPEIPLEQLIRWATLNGAAALGMDEEIGSFDTGKKPGILLLEGADAEKMLLKERTRMRRV